MIISNCAILDNIQIANNIWQMTFDAPEIAKRYEGPGQFISITLNNNDEHILRRPMSIAFTDDSAITIIYKIFGAVTNKLSKLISNDTINVLGPLGNTFDISLRNHTPVLIGGGIGLSPILNLDKLLRDLMDDVYTIIGAKSSDEHFLKHTGNTFLLSTDDGTIGLKGTVVDALNQIINKISNPYVFACGPEMMLKNLKDYLNEVKVPGQFSVESYMACGFGFCQGCAITNDNKSGYSLVCKEGPVFDYNEVRFD